MREVDDALRQDKMEGFFKRFGLPLFALIVVVLAAYGGWIYWQHRQEAQRAANSETFTQALDALKAGNADEAKKKLEGLVDGSEGSATSARLLLAGVALEQGRKADALKLFDQVAKDETAPKPMRDLAVVRGVSADFDNLKPEDVVARLKPYAAPGNAWFGAAGEMTGMAYIRMNQPDRAAPLFAAIAKDEKMEPGLRSRAGQLAAVLGADSLPDIVDENGDALGKGNANAASAATAMTGE